MKAHFDTHQCYGPGDDNHWLRCPACGHIERAGHCYYAVHSNGQILKGLTCPKCSPPSSDTAAQSRRVLMDCIEDHLNEGQRLLLEP